MLCVRSVPIATIIVSVYIYKTGIPHLEILNASKAETTARKFHTSPQLADCAENTGVVKIVEKLPSGAG